MKNKNVINQKIDEKKDILDHSKNEVNKDENDDKVKNHQKILTELKEEKENLNNKKADDKNNKEKNISFFTYNAKIALIATIIIVLIIAIFKLYAYNKKSIKTAKNNNISTIKIETTNNKETKTNAKVVDDFSKIKGLQENIDDLEKKLSYNDDYIKTLEDKIVELENIIEIQKEHLNSKNLNKIQILLDINKKIQKGQNYSSLLVELEEIGDNSAIQDNINILKQYQDNYANKKDIDLDFKKETKIFLNEYNILKNKKGNFAKFLSNFVVVRKINNTNKESPDNFILELENNLKDNNYLSAIQLIENNTEYAKYFSYTLKNLKEYVLLNDTIDKMINNFTNK